MILDIVKLHPDAQVPDYQRAGDACFDLHAIVPQGQVRLDAVLAPAITFGIGLSFGIPDGWAMLIFSRSGHGFKNDVRLANCVGVIDSGYRGEVGVRLTADVNGGLVIKHGERIAQAMLVPVVRVGFNVVDSLPETARGAGGFGSTGQ